MNTNKRLEEQIAELEGATELSKREASKLRTLKAALAAEIARVASKAGTKYGETSGHSGPTEKYLDGSAWDDFFARYCDPKGIIRAREEANAARDAHIETIRRPLIKKRGEQGTAFNLNTRKVVLMADVPVGHWVNLKTGVVDSRPAVVASEIPAKAEKVSTRKPRAAKSSTTITGTVLQGFGFGLERALELLKLADTDIDALRPIAPRLALNVNGRLDRLRSAVAQAQAA